MSSDDLPVRLPGSHDRLGISGVWRAVAILVAWLPFACLMNYDLPKYLDYYERVAKIRPLPQYTHYLFQFGRFNDDKLTVPILALVTAVVLIDLGLPRVLGPSRGRWWLQAIWLLLVIVIGVLTIPAYVIAFHPMDQWVPHTHGRAG